MILFEYIENVKGMDAMREGKTWIIKNKFIVTEREHIHDVSDFSIDLLDGRMLGILFPYSVEQERHILEELNAGTVNFNQAGMEWLSDDEKALYGQLWGNSEGNG